jgi:CRISPR-associated protein Cas2
MTVLVANDTPPAVRGLLKRWFVEPRPNVFVGSVNARTRSRTIDSIRRHAPDLGLLLMYDDDSCQGFEIVCHGETPRRPVRRCGLGLLAEKWAEENGGAPPC